MQHASPNTDNLVGMQPEKRGFELSPIRASDSPPLSQQVPEVIDSVEIRQVRSDDDDDSSEDDEHLSRKEDEELSGNDSQQIAMEELQAALKAAGLPLIGGECDDRDDRIDVSLSGLIIEGAGGGTVEKISESGSLLTLAQMHNVSADVIALGAAHSQKRDYQIQIKRDDSRESNESLTSQVSIDRQANSEETSRIGSPDKSQIEERKFDFSPLDTIRDDPRGFDLSPATPFSPQLSPAVAQKALADAEVEAIVADVKKVETELQRVVNSTKKKIQKKKPLAAKFSNLSPRVSQMPMKSRVVKKKEEPGYLKSTASTDLRYGWGAGGSGKVSAGDTKMVSSSHTLRQTHTLEGIQLGKAVGSDVGVRERLMDVETSVGNVDAVQLAASVDSFASYLHQFVEQAPGTASSVAMVSVAGL